MEHRRVPFYLERDMSIWTNCILFGEWNTRDYDDHPDFYSSFPLTYCYYKYWTVFAQVDVSMTDKDLLKKTYFLYLRILIRFRPPCIPLLSTKKRVFMKWQFNQNKTDADCSHDIRASSFDTRQRYSIKSQLFFSLSSFFLWLLCFWTIGV